MAVAQAAGLIRSLRRNNGKPCRLDRAIKSASAGAKGRLFHRTALGMRGEPIAHLHESAEALGISRKVTRGIRSERALLYRCTAAMTALAGARTPDGPVTSADADIEIFGDAIGQNELGLHAAAGTVLRVVCDRSRSQWLSRPLN